VDVLHISIEGATYAVPLARVLEILPRVWLTPLPEAPPHVAGIFAYHGEVALAVDVRRRLGHGPAAPLVSDHFVLTRGRTRPLAVIVDRVHGVHALSAEALRAPPFGAPSIAGVVALPDGLLLVDDLDALLSVEDENAAERGIQALAG